MRFASKHDIEAPIADTFRIITDFEAWERAAMRRGADVARTDKLRVVTAGLKWAARFAYRGRTRALDLELKQIEAPSLLRFVGLSQSIEGTASIELMEMGAKRTRMHVVFELTPRSLTARLFLQSMRLARNRIDRRFDQRMDQLAADIEARYRAVRPY
jgi:carbon monoxide dehydrogenase subunit G